MCQVPWWLVACPRQLLEVFEQLSGNYGHLVQVIVSLVLLLPLNI